MPFVPRLKRLSTLAGDRADGTWTVEEVEWINSSLSARTDVAAARALRANRQPKRCFQGQIPANDGFMLAPAEARALLDADARNADVIFPYLIGRDLLEEGRPSRWIIDFGQRPLLEAMGYAAPFARIRAAVMPDVLQRAEREKRETGKETTRWTRVAERWWQFRDQQPGLMSALGTLPRYVAVSRVTKRPIFAFVASEVHPDTRLVAFTLPDDYSFGVIQSGIHWSWVVAKGSTLKADQHYTANSVFDTFAWPQGPTAKQTRAVADAAVALRALRRRVMERHGWSLRDLYRTLDTPGKNELRDAHAALDDAVRAAYGMKKGADVLAFLLALNGEVAGREARGEAVVGPGLPPCVGAAAAEAFVTDDCIRAPEL